MSYLVVLSSTEKQDPNPEPLPALLRFVGRYPSLLKSLQKQAKFPKCDVIFVTANGIIFSQQNIGVLGFRMTLEMAKKMREQNLRALTNIFSTRKYDAVYVNVDKIYLKSIKGFDKLTNAVVTYAKGVLGERTTHMKRWGLEHALH